MRVGLRLRSESARVQLNLFTQRGFQEHIPSPMTLPLKSFFLFLCRGPRTLSGVKPPPHCQQGNIKSLSSLWLGKSLVTALPREAAVWYEPGQRSGTERANHSISRCQRGFPASLFVASGSPSEETCTAATRGLCHSHIQKRPLKGHVFHICAQAHRISHLSPSLNILFSLSHTHPRKPLICERRVYNRAT